MNDLISNNNTFSRSPQKHELIKICSEYLRTVIEKNSEITNTIVDLLIKV